MVNKCFYIINASNILSGKNYNWGLYIDERGDDSDDEDINTASAELTAAALEVKKYVHIPKVRMELSKIFRSFR